MRNSFQNVIQKIITKRFILIIVVISIILPVLTNLTPTLADNSRWWNHRWSYRQEIHLPIDTSLNQAKFQPIDVKIEFRHSCWAKNETVNSIRVIFQEEAKIEEIESQIYDLHYIDRDHIDACNIVFLIPKYADGKEKYYVYYSDTEAPPSSYPNHVDVKEVHYSYEYMPGYSISADYYQIEEEGFIPFIIAISGNSFEGSFSQQVTKLKSNSKEITPQNGEMLAYFDFTYCYGSNFNDYSSSYDQLVSNKILVDGNLMVRVSITSKSRRDDVQTTAIYTYYYCPRESKRIYAHVKHEILKECRVTSGRFSDIDGAFVTLHYYSFRSSSRKELNFGEIPPYAHLYTEDKIVREYKLDPYPHNAPNDWCRKIIDTNDDIDLADIPWSSFDYGETGKAQGIILASDNVVRSGNNERNGIQTALRERNIVNLPGLTINIAALQFARNSFETGSNQDRIIPKGLVVEFDAEIFSTESGGYKTIQEEAKIFHSLAKTRPTYIEQKSKKMTEERYSLTVYLHNAPSFPMGSLLSILDGNKFSYIKVELYREDRFISSKLDSRLPIKTLPNFENSKAFEKIISLIRMFDWKNSSIFKKVRFENLSPGRYLIKIYKENPLLGKKPRFIGYKIVDVENDTKTHIFCRPQSSLNVSVVDQQDRGVEGVELRLEYANTTISKVETSKDGRGELTAPQSLRVGEYTLKVYYKGFIIHKQQVKMNLFRGILSSKLQLKLNLYNLSFRLKDTWNLPCAVRLVPVLTSDEMKEPLPLYGNRTPDEEYIFADLPKATYQLTLKYNHFEMKREIRIPEENELEIVFPIEHTIKLNIVNSRGLPIDGDVIIAVRRGGKEIKLESRGSASLNIPPGNYNVEVYSEGNLIGKQKIDISYDSTLELVTTKEPVFPYIGLGGGIVLLSFGLIVFLKKKNYHISLKLIGVSFIFMSVVSPWWMLQGSSHDVEINAKMFLIPAKMITITKSPSFIGGEIYNLPEQFIHIVSILPFITLLCCILILFSILLTYLTRQKSLSIIMLFAGIAILVALIIVFYYGMLQLTDVGVGSFAGEGVADIVDDGTYSNIHYHWGPAIGFYLCIISIVVLMADLFGCRIEKFFK